MHKKVHNMVNADFMLTLRVTKACILDCYQIVSAYGHIYKHKKYSDLHIQ